MSTIISEIGSALSKSLQTKTRTDFTVLSALSKLRTHSAVSPGAIFKSPVLLILMILSSSSYAAINSTSEESALSVFLISLVINLSEYEKTSFLNVNPF